MPNCKEISFFSDKRIKLNLLNCLFETKNFKGRVNIDLRGTSFAFDQKTKWIMTGDKPFMRMRFNEVKIYESSYLIENFKAIIFFSLFL